MPHTREFQFTDQDFQHIRKLIHDYAGIALADSKKELVYSRLARRLRATGLKSFAEYLALQERRGVGSFHQLAHHQSHFLLSRGTSLHPFGGTSAKAR